MARSRNEERPGRVALCAGLHHELLKDKKRSAENAEAKADGHHDNHATPKQDGQRRRQVTSDIRITPTGTEQSAREDGINQR